MTAAEKKKIPCRFHFGTGTTCTKEETVNSVTQKIHRSPAGGRKSVRYAFLQRKCTKLKDCKYLHDKKVLAVIKFSVKAAAAKAQESPSGSPRARDPKAAAPRGKRKPKHPQ